MGGRGGGSGRSRGGGGAPPAQHQNRVQALASAYNNANIRAGTYDNGGNQALIAFQNMTPAEQAHAMHQAESINMNDSRYADGYGYHDIPLNRLLLQTGTKGGPERMSRAEFDEYVRSTGQTVLYRGWSGRAAEDRFKNAKNNHVGNGRYGDGYDFSESRSTAASFAGRGAPISRMALSPNARVIDYTQLKSMMAAEPRRLQSSLRKTGTGGSGRTFGTNVGEAQYALSKGYNVVRVNSGYQFAITADALVISD